MFVGQAVVGGLLRVGQAVGVHLRHEREPVGQGEVPHLQRHLASLGKPNRIPPGPGRLGDEDFRQPMACPAMAVGPFGKRRLSRRVARHQGVAVGLDGEQPSREPVRHAEFGLRAGLGPEIQPHRLAPRRTEDRQRPAEQIADGHRPLREPFPPRAWRSRADRSSSARRSGGGAGDGGTDDRRAIRHPNLEPRGDRGVLVLGVEEAVGERPPVEGIALAGPLVAHVVDHGEPMAAAVESAPGSRPGRWGSTATRRHPGPRRRRISRSTRRCRE